LRDILNNEGKIINTLIGDISPTELSIVTPITEIYSKMDSYFKLLDEGEGGWWESKICKVGKLEVLVAKTPQGNLLIDYILALRKWVKKIVLIGLCGGLDQHLDIGDVVAFSDAFFEGYIEKCRITTCDNLSENIIVGRTGTSLAFLLEDEKFIGRMGKVGAIAVDMETFFLYKYSNLYNIDAVSLAVVSDLPRKKRFFELNKKDKLAISRGIEKAIKIVGMTYEI